MFGVPEEGVRTIVRTVCKERFNTQKRHKSVLDFKDINTDLTYGNRPYVKEVPYFVLTVKI